MTHLYGPDDMSDHEIDEMNKWSAMVIEAKAGIDAAKEAESTEEAEAGRVRRTWLRGAMYHVEAWKKSRVMKKVF